MSNSYLEQYGITEAEYDETMDADRSDRATVYREGTSTRIEQTGDAEFSIYTSAGYIGRKSTLNEARTYLRECQDSERAYCQAHDI